MNKENFGGENSIAESSRVDIDVFREREENFIKNIEKNQKYSVQMRKTIKFMENHAGEMKNEIKKLRAKQKDDQSFLRELLIEIDRAFKRGDSFEDVKNCLEEYFIQLGKKTLRR